MQEHEKRCNICFMASVLQGSERVDETYYSLILFTKFEKL